MVVLNASSDRDAIRRAKKRGKQSEYSYRNADGQTVQIRFVGLIDVIDLVACEADEMYYSLQRMSNPARHVRRDDHLSVATSGAGTIGSAWWAVPKWFAEGKAPPGRRRTRRT